MDRVYGTLAFRIVAGAIVVAVTAVCSHADWPGDHHRGSGSIHDFAPVYQRHAFEWTHHGGRWRGHGRMSPAPHVSAGWFQRPYPYHLDYYRMRYGGSYAPYFGNLYGPPQVVTAPPYYGPYYGDFGVYGGYGAPADYPPPNGLIYQRNASPSQPSEQPGADTSDEGIPAPGP